MDIIKFAKEWNRMCRSNISCDECQIKHYLKEKGIKNFNNCGLVFRIYPEEMLSVIKKWSEEHPVNTRQSEFLKMHPNASLYNGYIDICPKKIDINLEETIDCNMTPCFECKEKYWAEEVE